MLVICPFIIAFGNLSMGELRGLNPIVVPFYSNISIFLANAIYCASSSTGFFPSEEE